MKQDNNKQPLYKVLNEKRTPGEWFVSPQSLFIRAESRRGWNILVVENQPPYSEANALYTALAVNNLSHLAEALEFVTEQLTVFSDMDVSNKGAMNMAIKQAKEALQRIS